MHRNRGGKVGLKCIYLYFFFPVLKCHRPDLNLLLLLTSARATLARYCVHYYPDRNRGVGRDIIYHSTKNIVGIHGTSQ